MDFEIPEPCQERWTSMQPRAEGRYCARCEHVVLDLSAMTRREAEKRVARVEGSYVCVRLAMSEAGEALFRPPPPSPVKRLAGGLVLVAALTAGGCGEREPSATGEVALEVEPCAIDAEPAMSPVGDEPAIIADAEAIDAEAIEADDDGADAAVVPTAEQRELTRRKHRAREAAAHPHIRHMVAGRMPLNRAF